MEGVRLQLSPITSDCDRTACPASVVVRPFLPSNSGGVREIEQKVAGEHGVLCALQPVHAADVLALFARIGDAVAHSAAGVARNRKILGEVESLAVEQARADEVIGEDLAGGGLGDGAMRFRGLASGGLAGPAASVKRRL